MLAYCYEQMFLNTLHLFNRLHKGKQSELKLGKLRYLSATTLNNKMQIYIHLYCTHRYEHEAILKSKTENKIGAPLAPKKDIPGNTQGEP